MRLLLLVAIIILCTSFHAHANLAAAPQIAHALKRYCESKHPSSGLERAIHNLRPKRCHRFLKNSGNPIHLRFPPKHISLAHLHLHLPQVEVIEEEDDFFNDDLYMWFVITRDGVPQTKVTKIYRNYDEHSVLLFDSEDRIISNFPFYQHMIVDFGLVESDGDDITEMQRLSAHALELVQLVYQAQTPQQQASLGHQLRQETIAVMNLLLGLDHDDRLFSGTLNITFEHTYQAWQNGGVFENLQEFRGRHLGSDWHYRITWRYLLIEVTNPFPTTQMRASSLL